MKFLCVPCDTPMKLRTVAPPDRGSLSVVYTCPECGYEMAMLTNAYETQVVQSLGVRIGPATDGGRQAPDARRQTPYAELETPDAAAHASAASHQVPTAANGVARAVDAAASGCPFAAMVPGTGAVETPATAPVGWTAAAEARLANIPSFVRPMARVGIEQFARERGVSQVDDTILDAAREHFGM